MLCEVSNHSFIIRTFFLKPFSQSILYLIIRQGSSETLCSTYTKPNQHQHYSHSNKHSGTNSSWLSWANTHRKQSTTLTRCFQHVQNAQQKCSRGYAPSPCFLISVPSDHQSENWELFTWPQTSPCSNRTCSYQVGISQVLSHGYCESF